MVDIPDDRPVHQTSVKVRFYELDPYDHVNHTNYFSYFETARIELLTERGLGLDLMKEQGWQLVVVEAHARFLAAARYGEELTIHTWVESIGRVKSRRRDQRPTYPDGAYCIWMPPIRSTIAVSGPAERSRSPWRSRSARLRCRSLRRGGEPAIRRAGST